MFSALGRRVLLQRAQDYVNRYQPQLIGVAGSWGVSLTKQALATILSDYTTLRVAADRATSRVDVAMGVVSGKRSAHGWMWLLGAGRIQEAVGKEPKTIIVELPARRPGQIDEVAGFLPFSVAVVTSVHSSRLEFFSSKELAAHELLSLPASLSGSGIAVLNMDEPLLAAAENLKARASLAGRQVVGYGQTPAAHVHIERLQPHGQGFAIELIVEGKIFEGHLPFIGTRLQAQAVVAALATAYAITHDARVIKDGLTKLRMFSPPAGYAGSAVMSGYTVIDDTFDATPESMQADLHALARSTGRKFAILGDLVELGGASSHWHGLLGEEAAQSANILIFVGDHMRQARAAALSGGHNIDTHHFESSRDVGKWLRNYVRKGDTLLIAGSHEMKMNEVTKRL